MGDLTVQNTHAAETLDSIIKEIESEIVKDPSECGEMFNQGLMVAVGIIKKAGGINGQTD